MVYITNIFVKGKRYYVLAHNIRVGTKIKRVVKYIGKNLPSKQKLDTITAEFESEIKILEEPELLSEKQKEIIEKIRKNYQTYLKKISKNDIERLEANVLTNFTYNTNAIEGSKLTVSDVMSVFEGATPESKPLRDIYGAKNMREAYNYIRNLRKLSQKELLELHKIVMRDILTMDLGEYRTVPVFIGQHKPPSVSQVARLMKNLFGWYRIAGKKLHPFELACKLHVKFETIHPFRDGNGRVGRLIMNYPLLKSGYPLLDIKFSDKPKYYAALEKIQLNKTDFKSFIDFAFNTYVKIAKHYEWL